MLNMRYVDQVLFGRQAFSELSAIVREWAEIAKLKHKGADATAELR
jgi:hypothetical protein